MSKYKFYRAKIGKQLSAELEEHNINVMATMIAIDKIRIFKRR